MIIDRLGSKEKDLKTPRWCAKYLAEAQVRTNAKFNHNDQLCKEIFETFLVPNPVGNKSNARNALGSGKSSKSIATVVSSTDDVNNETKL